MAESVIRRCRPLLGTFVEITMPSSCAAAVDAAFLAVRDVHESMSFHEETSDLAAMRRAPAGEAIRVAPGTVAVLSTAVEFHRLSDGIFDVSVGRRLVAAGYLPRPPSVSLRQMTGTTADLEIIDDRRVVCHKPMLIDLGGIAKGYAVDRAVEVLLSLSVPYGIVNAGGDLRTFGPHEEIVHLRSAEGMIDGAVALEDAAMASSSNRHLRRKFRGRETSPHFDGRGGSVLSQEAVTVVAPTCMVADAMTKIAMVDAPIARKLLQGSGGDIIDRTTSLLH